MINPLEFYTNTKAELEKKAIVLKIKSARLSTFRFAVFLGISFLIYSFFGIYPVVFIIAFFGIALFSFLVFKYIKLKKEKAIIDAKIKINTTEIREFLLYLF